MQNDLHNELDGNTQPAARPPRHAPMLVLVVVGVGLSVAGFLATRYHEKQRVRADFTHAADSVEAACRGMLEATIHEGSSDATLHRTLRPLVPLGIEFTVDDVSMTPPQKPRPDHPGRAVTPSDKRSATNRDDLTRQAWFTIGDRRWIITTAATPDFLARRETWRPWTLLLGGLAASMMLAAYWATRANRIAALAAMRELRQNAQMVRTILDSVQAGIVVVHPDTKEFVDVNRAAETMLGATKEQLVGRHCFDFICADEEATHKGPGHCRVTSEAALRLRRMDGQRMPILKTVVPVMLGQRQYLLETFIDVTAYEKAEEARHAGEKKLLAISDCAIDALVMIDPEGRVTHWNPAAQRLFGYSAEEILGRNVHAVLASEAEFASQRENFRKFTRNGQGPVIGRLVELEAVHKNGSLLPVEISISSIQLEQQWWAVAVIRDLTERKEAERQLRRHTRALEMANQALEIACHEAEAANAAKSEFLANMSHELRTPLHGILSFASFGLKKGRTVSVESLLEYFQLIHDSGRSLLALVNNLLDLAKLESGKLHLELAPLDLGELIVKTADEFRSQVSQRSITIECQVPPEGATVVVDHARMQQVVRNLLSNAIKFSSDGGRVCVTVSRTSDGVTIAVRDHGIGIPPAELATVFDKFVQSSKTRTSAGGTGLGLAICREIVAAHQGHIRAHNAPDGGAILTLTIPENLEVEEPIGVICPADDNSILPASEISKTTTIFTSNVG